MAKLIELKGISKSYDGEKVIDSMNLYIRDKEFITLLGPSGCGKTTTLRIIGGFESADEGQLFFDGVEISDVPAHKRQVNTVFQKYALFPHLNVYENIAFALRLKKTPEEEIYERAPEVHKKKEDKPEPIEKIKNKEVKKFIPPKEEKLDLPKIKKEIIASTLKREDVEKMIRSQISKINIDSISRRIVKDVKDSIELENIRNGIFN